MSDDRSPIAIKVLPKTFTLRDLDGRRGRLIVTSDAGAKGDVSVMQLWFHDEKENILHLIKEDLMSGGQ